MPRRAYVTRIHARSPDDVEALEAAIKRGEIEARSIVAILGKTEGNGCVNDFTRAFAVRAMQSMLANHMPREAVGRIAMVMSGGTEGCLSPHWIVFAAREVAEAAEGGALALGVARTPDVPGEHVGRRSQIELVAAGVEAAMADAGIASADEVHYVQVKCPLLTIERIEEAGKRFAAEAEVPLEIGKPLSPVDAARIVERMADRLFEACSAKELSKETAALLRLDGLANRQRPEKVSFSGGVSEYIYGREPAAFGDLGPLLGAAIRKRVEGWRGVEIVMPDQGIRATVVGASQYTVQVSGSTIFVTPVSTLPLRSVPAITPDLPLSAEELSPAEIAAAIESSLRRFDLHEGQQPVAMCYRWDGSATWQRLDHFCQGVAQGLKAVLEQGHPLVLVGDSDVGGLVGIHAHEETKLENAIVSIDGVNLKEFDFIDIGAMLPASGAVPVVIKSLVFPTTTALGKVEG